MADTHECQALAVVAEMTGTVDYTPPPGWLGRLVDPVTTRLAMFRFRHAPTKASLKVR